MTFSVGSSSVNKGESLRDTVETIEAMGVDASSCATARRACRGRSPRWIDASVDQRRRRLARAPDPGAARLLHDPHRARPHGGSTGLRIAIVGDIKHCRVARSDVLAFTALGAEVTLVAPPTLLPPSLDGWPVEVSHDLDDVLPKLDVVYLLRMQRERMTEALVPILREYTTPLRAHRRAGRRACAEHALVMHPGPMNRGVEIAAEVGRPARRGDHRPGAQRRRRAHGGAVPAARRGRATWRAAGRERG